MRIIGLPKLIKDEESEEVCLQNCNLVVDGHSFFYNSYEDSSIPYVFGCDAKEFARYVRVNKLLKFKRANVKCYFVFKGGDSDIDEKIKKIKTSKFDFGQNFKFVPPVFMREVCLQMLTETDVKYATCVAENIDDCAALAEALNCPVLSSNIDYCFKTVPYIPLSTLRYSNPNNFITCRQYNLKSFMEKHSLTERKVVIFAALSDVRFFEQNYFEDLFKSWDVSDENLYERNKKLIKWLSEHNEDEAVTDISIFITDENESKKFSNRIQTLLDNMHNKKWGIAACYLFKNCRTPFMIPDPWWFEKGVVTQEIAIPYINLYKYKIIQGSTAIEKKNSIDSIMLSMDIIVYAYNLLTNFRKSQISVFQDAENITQINTDDFNVSKPDYSCVVSVFENGWEVVRNLNLFEHFLRESNLNIELIMESPVEAKIVIITLAYFSHKKVSVDADVIKIVYCIFIYHALSHRLRLHELHPSEDNQHEINYLEKIMNKYSKLETYEQMEIFDEGKLNTLVELQYCLLHMNYLNTLCGTPYFPTRYHRFVNFVFIYKLLRDMEDCTDIEVFVENMFLSAPNTLRSISLFVSHYKSLLNHEKPSENWRVTAKDSSA